MPLFPLPPDVPGDIPNTPEPCEDFDSKDPGGGSKSPADGVLAGEEAAGRLTATHSDTTLRSAGRSLRGAPTFDQTFLEARPNAWNTAWYSRCVDRASGKLRKHWQDVRGPLSTNALVVQGLVTCCLSGSRRWLPPWGGVHDGHGGVTNAFFFFTRVTGPRRSLSLKLSDAESL